MNISERGISLNLMKQGDCNFSNSIILFI